MNLKIFWPTDHTDHTDGRYNTCLYAGNENPSNRRYPPQERYKGIVSVLIGVIGGQKLTGGFMTKDEKTYTILGTFFDGVKLTGRCFL